MRPARWSPTPTQSRRIRRRRAAGGSALAYDYIHMQNHLDPDGKPADIGSMNHKKPGPIGRVRRDRSLCHLRRSAVRPGPVHRIPSARPHDAGWRPSMFRRPTMAAITVASRTYRSGPSTERALGRWAVTPGIEYGRPTHDYPDFTHAAIGGNETSTSLGVRGRAVSAGTARPLLLRVQLPVHLPGTVSGHVRQRQAPVSRSKRTSSRRTG